ncbi:MAG: phytanoyl-CoA dioxygenase, partial [Actinomycetota bacterium]|nr:phytanoyl-CoA dioxygenase [Actinomycetota bacterium]
MTDVSDAVELSPAEYAEAMAEYLLDGERRALALGNRGPVRFDGDGNLQEDILAAYWEHGFYVFDPLIGEAELDVLRREVDDMVERAPAHPGEALDAQGRPALGRDYAVEPYLFIKPLSDPWGGTDLLAGRHPTKMAQPTPA